VAIANPYRMLSESSAGAGSITCRGLTVSGEEGEFIVTQDAGNPPANCYLPATMPAAISGPNGVDPMRHATSGPACASLHSTTDADFPADDPLARAGHCWLHVPESQLDAGGPFAPAQTDITGTPTAWNVSAVGQGSSLVTSTPPVTGTPVTPAAPVTVTPAKVTTPTPKVTPAVAQPLALPALRSASAKAKTRTALRRMFGTLPASAKVSCVNTGGASARCSVSWRRSGASYRGTVRVWFVSDAHQVRWVYGANVRRTQGGTTRTITRSAVTGGAVATTAG
jgi:hypothetical protein